MKLLRLLFLAFLGCLALAACAPNTGNLASGAPASSKQIVGSEGGLYAPQDLSLVANTGRPQFLDSYADW